MKELNIDIEGAPSTLEKALMQSLKELITTLQASGSTADVLRKVMHQLAETDVETCCWVLENFCDLEAYLELIEQVMRYATQVLIDKGFILGQDFSANPAGGILIKEKASTTLMEEAAAFDRLLLEDIMQVLD